MPAPKANTSKTPESKVSAGAAGVAAATLCVFISKKAGIEYSVEDAIAVTGALGTLFSFGFGYAKS